MTSCRGAVLGLLLLLAPAPAAATTFDDLAERVNVSIAKSFGRSVPLLAASAGVTYRFDAATANFEREPAITGQLLLERADPIGAHRWNLSFSYQYVALDTFDGKPTDDLRDPVPIRTTQNPAIPAIRLNVLDLEPVTHQFTGSVTYGVTDDLDVNLTVPLVYSDLFAAASVDRAIILGGTAFRQSFALDDQVNDVGIGDVVLRGKLRLLERDDVRAAAGLVLRFPSGDDEDLQGTGSFEAVPLAYVSTRSFVPASWARLQGYLNAGVTLDADDVGASEPRWGVGLDWGIGPDVTAALAVLGRHPLRRIAPPGFFDFPRCGPSLAACVLGRDLPPAPLFGLTGQRPDYYDLAVGGRVNLWRDTVVGFANVVVPLNDAGIRTEPIPLIGVEATF